MSEDRVITSELSLAEKWALRCQGRFTSIPGIHVKIHRVHMFEDEWDVIVEPSDHPKPDEGIKFSWDGMSHPSTFSVDVGLDCKYEQVQPLLEIALGIRNQILEEDKLNRKPEP